MRRHATQGQAEDDADENDDLEDLMVSAGAEKQGSMSLVETDNQGGPVSNYPQVQETTPSPNEDRAQRVAMNTARRLSYFLFKKGYHPDDIATITARCAANQAKYILLHPLVAEALEMSEGGSGDPFASLSDDVILASLGLTDADLAKLDMAKEDLVKAFRKPEYPQASGGNGGTGDSESQFATAFGPSAQVAALSTPSSSDGSDLTGGSGASLTGGSGSGLTGGPGRLVEHGSQVDAKLTDSASKNAYYLGQAAGTSAAATHAKKTGMPLDQQILDNAIIAGKFGAASALADGRGEEQAARDAAKAAAQAVADMAPAVAAVAPEPCPAGTSRVSSATAASVAAAKVLDAEVTKASISAVDKAVDTKLKALQAQTVFAKAAAADATAAAVGDPLPVTAPVAVVSKSPALVRPSSLVASEANQVAAEKTKAYTTSQEATDAANRAAAHAAAPAINTAATAAAEARAVVDAGARVIGQTATAAAAQAVVTDATAAASASNTAAAARMAAAQASVNAAVQAPLPIVQAVPEGGTIVTNAAVAAAVATAQGQLTPATVGKPVATVHTLEAGPGAAKDTAGAVEEAAAQALASANAAAHVSNASATMNPNSTAMKAATDEHGHVDREVASVGLTAGIAAAKFGAQGQIADAAVQDAAIYAGALEALHAKKAKLQPMQVAAAAGLAAAQATKKAMGKLLAGSRAGGGGGGLGGSGSTSTDFDSVLAKAAGVAVASTKSESFVPPLSTESAARTAGQSGVDHSKAIGDTLEKTATAAGVSAADSMAAEKPGPCVSNADIAAANAQTQIVPLTDPDGPTMPDVLPPGSGVAPPCPPGYVEPSVVPVKQAGLPLMAQPMTQPVVPLGAPLKRGPVPLDSTVAETPMAIAASHAAAEVLSSTGIEDPMTQATASHAASQGEKETKALGGSDIAQAQKAGLEAANAADGTVSHTYVSTPANLVTVAGTPTAIAQKAAAEAVRAMKQKMAAEAASLVQSPVTAGRQLGPNEVKAVINAAKDAATDFATSNGNAKQVAEEATRAAKALVAASMRDVAPPVNFLQLNAGESAINEAWLAMFGTSASMDQVALSAGLAAAESARLNGHAVNQQLADAAVAAAQAEAAAAQVHGMTQLQVATAAGGAAAATLKGLIASGSSSVPPVTTVPRPGPAITSVTVPSPAPELVTVPVPAPDEVTVHGPAVVTVPVPAPQVVTVPGPAPESVTVPPGLELLTEPVPIPAPQVGTAPALAPHPCMHALAPQIVTPPAPVPQLPFVPGPVPAVATVPTPAPQLPFVPAPVPEVAVGPVPAVATVPAPAPQTVTLPAPVPQVAVVPGPVPAVAAVPAPVPDVPDLPVAARRKFGKYCDEAIVVADSLTAVFSKTAKELDETAQNVLAVVILAAQKVLDQLPVNMTQKDVMGLVKPFIAFLAKQAKTFVEAAKTPFNSNLADAASTLDCTTSVAEIQLSLKLNLEAQNAATSVNAAAQLMTESAANMEKLLGKNATAAVAYFASLAHTLADKLTTAGRDAAQQLQQLPVAPAVVPVVPPVVTVAPTVVPVVPPVVPNVDLPVQFENSEQLLALQSQNAKIVSMQKKIDEQQRLLKEVVQKLSSGKPIADLIFGMDTALVPKHLPSGQFLGNVSQDPASAKKALGATMSILSRELEKVSAGKAFADSIFGQDTSSYGASSQITVPAPVVQKAVALPPVVQPPRLSVAVPPVPALPQTSAAQLSKARLPVSSIRSQLVEKAALVSQTAKTAKRHLAPPDFPRPQMMRHQSEEEHQSSKHHEFRKHSHHQEATIDSQAQSFSMKSPASKRALMSHLPAAEESASWSLIEEAATAMTSQKMAKHLGPDVEAKKQEAKEELKEGLAQAAAESVALRATTDTNSTVEALVKAQTQAESPAALVFIIALAGVLGFCSVGGVTYLVFFGPADKEDGSLLPQAETATAEQAVPVSEAK